MYLGITLFLVFSSILRLGLGKLVGTGLLFVGWDGGTFFNDAMLGFYRLLDLVVGFTSIFFYAGNGLFD